MPLLEVRRSCDGHPPVTGRERDILLNGTSGVKNLEDPSGESGSGFFVRRTRDTAQHGVTWNA